jgi:hypothetical protein
MTLARKDTRTRMQECFLMCYEQTGQILGASRGAKVARSAHYRWLEKDPTYLPRFQDARIKATQGLKDEAVRRAMDGVRKLVLYKGQPVRVEGQLLYEHKYSDHLMIKLLEAGDPDNFNRQRVMPLDEGKLDTLTEGQVRQILAWLRKRIQVAESIYGPRQPAAAKTGASKFPAVFRGDGWPYKREKKRKR